MISRTKIQTYPAITALLALTIAGCGSVPVAPTRDSNSQVSEAVGVQELRREVAELRDAMEVQRNELQKMRERQRQLYDDLDYRLRQSEQNGSTARRGSQGQSDGQQIGYGQATQQGYGQGQSQGQTTGQQGGNQGQQQGSGESSRADGQQSSGENQSGGQSQQAAYDQQQSQQGSGQGTATQQMAVASADEQAAYDDAFELLKQSRYNDAIIDFRSMTTQFPNGALVDDAQYWIGEAYYVTRDFQNALGAFQSVVNRYPDSQRVPEALLKLGYVQAELGQKEQARQTLNQVISQYPGSRVAISAETRLSKIQ